jgi:hypothetical protein
MTGAGSPPDALGPDSVEHALRVAQALDPTCSEESICRFLLEILEASAALGVVDVVGPPSVVPFNATWPEETER